jgi:preprotein translocase subunit SecG
MYTFLVALLVVDGFVLGVVVLLQAGKGGGLAAMGGGTGATDGILAGRQATSVLTRASWILGFSFMLLALVLSIMSSRSQQPSSMLEQDFRQQQLPATAPEPILPGQLGGSGATTPAPVETAPPVPASP